MGLWRQASGCTCCGAMVPATGGGGHARGEVTDQSQTRLNQGDAELESPIGAERWMGATE
jgi:hypothetical protein